MSQALSGIRVLDLSNVLAGPLCAYELALLGAEVIKVEVPKTGDLARQLGADPELNARHMGASFLAQNGGKKSITLNLKSEAGKEVLRRLVRTADVLVENFRPGVMDRLGLGYHELREFNPSLVYCAISGFGQDGPMKDAPAYDQIIQGLSGMMSVTGDEDSGPLRAGYPVADTHRRPHGRVRDCRGAAAARAHGQRRRSSTWRCSTRAIVSLGWVVSNHLIAGVTPRALGNDNFTAAPSGTFRTQDRLLNIAANKQEQFEALAQALGREDLVADARFAGRECRKRNRAAAHSRARDRARGKVRGGMGSGAESRRRAGGPRTDRARSAGARADQATRVPPGVRQRPGCGPRHHARALRLQAVGRRSGRVGAATSARRTYGGDTARDRL